MARAFDMRVLAFDPAPNDVLAAVLGFEYVGLDELSRAATSSRCTPLPRPPRAISSTPTRSRRSAPARCCSTPLAGDLVDTAAVLAALDSGRLGGAGLDVVEGEHDVSEDFALLGDAPPRPSRPRWPAACWPTATT
jgi:D-3-phosphoglycerate dehydrogenase